MSTSPIPEVVPKIEANPEHKRLNLYKRELLLLRRPPRYNKHGSTHSSRHARHVVRRVETNQVEFGFSLRQHAPPIHLQHMGAV